VRLLEFGQEGRRLYCAIELVMGQSLWRVWDACKMRQSRLRYDWLAYVGARVAEGLHHAHELKDESGKMVGFVHRDVSPSNVLVSYDGRVKIIDFGLAKAEHRLSKTTVGVVKGKYAYMAPEQTQTSHVDRRADVFSLGVTLWELSADRRLFKKKDDVETLIAVSEAKVPDPCGLVMGYPRPLWRILRRAMRKEPEKRYQTALEMGRELDAFSRSEGRKLGQKDVADIMHASVSAGAGRQSVSRVSVEPMAPEEWKKQLPPGLLNERKK
jgi:serine/threonine-protein kinase